MTGIKCDKCGCELELSHGPLSDEERGSNREGAVKQNIGTILDKEKQICIELEKRGYRIVLPPSADPEKEVEHLRSTEPSGMRRLRWLLAMSWAGDRLYRDDGEYSDPASGIDFRRDSVPEIERKMWAYSQKVKEEERLKLAVVSDQHA